MKIVKYTDIEPVEFNNKVAMGIKAHVLIGKNDGAEPLIMLCIIPSGIPEL